MIYEINFSEELDDFINSRRKFINSHLNPLWCSWFTGLIDGEGYFHLVRRHTQRSFEVELVVNLRIDDQRVLEEIHHILKIGSLYKIDDELQRKQGIKASDRMRWRCCKADEIVNVILPIFENYPLHSKKALDYKIWREAAFIKYKNLHLKSGYDRMMQLVEELKEIRNNTPLNNRQFVRKYKRNY